MRKPELKRIIAALRQLSPAQRKVVVVELVALQTQSTATEIVDGCFASSAMCLHCKSSHVVRHSHANGLQRYRCRDCGKTFSALTDTSLNGLHKRGKWLGTSGPQTGRKGCRTRTFARVSSGAGRARPLRCDDGLCSECNDWNGAVRRTQAQRGWGCGALH